MIPEAVIYNDAIIPVTESYNDHSKSTAKHKKFRPNLHLHVAVVVNHLELHATPDKAHAAKTSALNYPQKRGARIND